MIDIKNRRPGERITGVCNVHMAELQADMCCDQCGAGLALGTRVLGKVVKVESDGFCGSRFSPTCMVCAGWN